MRLFFSFVIKECLHIMRDYRTLLIMFGVPFVAMLFIGFSFSADLYNSPVVIVSPDNDSYVCKLTHEIDASPYFNIVGTVSSVSEAVDMMKRDKAYSSIIFSPSFSRHIYDGQCHMNILIDGKFANMSIKRQEHLMGIINSTLAVKHSNPISVNILYNRDLSVSYYYIPGILGMILLIICAMMTSISIVREKESGTMDQILTSSMKPALMITAKAVPYFIISEFIFFITVIETRFILNIPINGSILLLMALGTIYVIVGISLGLLFSIVSDSQVSAILWSGLLLLLPTLLLSGMIIPLDNIPMFLRWLSYIQPSTWFISACRKLMIMGSGWFSIYKELTVLCCMCLGLISVCVKLLKNRME